MTRLTAIALLLRSRSDLVYDPPTWTGQLVQRQSRAGEGPSRRSLCDHCNGEGSVRRRGIPYRCEPCDGRGWLVTDAYTERPIGTIETGTLTRTATVRCDACGGQGAFGNGGRCPYCGGAGVIDLPVSRLTATRITLNGNGHTPASGDPIIDTLERREASGSYAELGICLDLLRGDSLFAYRVLQLVYAHSLAEPEQLGTPNLEAHDFGMSYLDGLMPREIRVPSWAARNERRRREKLKRAGRVAA